MVFAKGHGLMVDPVKVSVKSLVCNQNYTP